MAVRFLQGPGQSMLLVGGEPREHRNRRGYPEISGLPNPLVKNWQTLP